MKNRRIKGMEKKKKHKKSSLPPQMAYARMTRKWISERWSGKKGREKGKEREKRGGKPGQKPGLG
jgi:hypothetical protein